MSQSRVGKRNELVALLPAGGQHGAQGKLRTDLVHGPAQGPAFGDMQHVLGGRAEEADARRRVDGDDAVHGMPQKGLDEALLLFQLIHEFHDLPGVAYGGAQAAGAHAQGDDRQLGLLSERADERVARHQHLRAVLSRLPDGLYRIGEAGEFIGAQAYVQQTRILLRIFQHGTVPHDRHMASPGPSRCQSLHDVKRRGGKVDDRQVGQHAGKVLAAFAIGDGHHILDAGSGLQQFVHTVQTAAADKLHIPHVAMFQHAGTDGDGPGVCREDKDAFHEASLRQLFQKTVSVFRKVKRFARAAYGRIFIFLYDYTLLWL